MRERPPSDAERSPGADTETEAHSGEGGKWLLCKSCGEKICPESARSHVQGKHQHAFFNPHGLVFDIGCFRTAPGCVAIGRPSAEFTWFAGYAWRVALCSGCLTHLGWRYEGESVFFGLIMDGLTPESDDE